MTWFETRERTRIIREVEAAAAVDLSGRLPWSEAWAPYFTDRNGLLHALHVRWERMCIARLEELSSPERISATAARLRRSNVGILRILERHGLVGLPVDGMPAHAQPLTAA